MQTPPGRRRKEPGSGALSPVPHPASLGQRRDQQSGLADPLPPGQPPEPPLPSPGCAAGRARGKESAARCARSRGCQGQAGASQGPVGASQRQETGSREKPAEQGPAQGIPGALAHPEPSRAASARLRRRDRAPLRRPVAPSPAAPSLPLPAGASCSAPGGAPLCRRAMVSWIICRVVVLVFGMLYPAYASYKAVKTKNIREYVRWMMYWIVFALFMAMETLTDMFVSWFPFYYEIKMAFVVWLLSPYTKGASLLYRKFVHPTLSRREKEIDLYITQAKERGYETMVNFGKKSLNIAATAAVQAAAKSQGALAGRLRSFSMQDLRAIPDDTPVHYEDPLYLEEQEMRRRPIGYRTASAGRQPGRESDTEEEECWSDSQISPKALPRSRDFTLSKPLSRSQSLRVVKKRPQVKEGSSRLVRGRARKKAVQPDQDS
ncbi:receptor expression-enhancing protein 4 [Lepidochelys kempii]|uniref:receptor expression-enhancing protein 4 n=1 Tax=Lepidochelys kempii TaxID=8472 RepID=UPI003C6F3EA8